MVLVSRRVLAIIGLGAAAAVAAKATTGSIPIVFVTGADPVKLGLVASISRPEGNVTGVCDLISIMSPKRLELLHEILPAVGTTALLANPSNPIRADAFETQASAASVFGGRLEVLTANTEGDLDAAFAAMVQRRVGALIVMPDPFFFAQRERLVALAARYAVPTIFPARVFAEVGGLMSYGTNLTELYRQAGDYAGKILKGAKPADLPVQQSTKFELVINLKTAKALGIAVPDKLLTVADEVIE